MLNVNTVAILNSLFIKSFLIDIKWWTFFKIIFLFYRTIIKHFENSSCGFWFHQFSLPRFFINLLQYCIWQAWEAAWSSSSSWTAGGWPWNFRRIWNLETLYGQRGTVCKVFGSFCLVTMGAIQNHFHSLCQYHHTLDLEFEVKKSTKKNS